MEIARIPSSSYPRASNNSAALAISLPDRLRISFASARSYVKGSLTNDISVSSGINSSASAPITSSPEIDLNNSLLLEGGILSDERDEVIEFSSAMKHSLLW